MPSKTSFFNSFLSLFLLLFHLGCFLFPAKTPPTKKRKLRKPSSPPPPPSPPKTHSPLSFLNPWLYLKPIFSFKIPRHHSKRCDNSPSPPPLSTTLRSSPDPTATLSRKRSFASSAESDDDSFTTRTDIFPCPICGEIFHKTQNLETHQSSKHALQELRDNDTAANIVKIIFHSAWNPKEKNRQLPKIQRILKIHNHPRILAKFQEYRESMKMKSSRGGGGRWSERCAVDGNELLRFQCSTFMCSLGQQEAGKMGGICGGEFCSVCGIIRNGFSVKLDGNSTMGSSRRAHESIPEEMEEEFAYLNVRRAMLVCRVVAGRVAREGGLNEKEKGGFDSLLVCNKGGGGPAEGEDELLVFNPRAVLPCFVVVYTV